MVQLPVGATVHQGDDDGENDAAQVQGEALQPLGDQATTQHNVLLEGRYARLQGAWSLSVLG